MNPGHCLPAVDESGAAMMDPVHPLKEGYMRIADMICEAAVKLGAKPEDSRKRAGSLMGPPGKKTRMEIPRPRWVEEGPSHRVGRVLSVSPVVGIGTPPPL